MKRIKLTQGRFALVDDEDFEWLNTWKWHASKGSSTYYAITALPYSNGGGHVKMHRMLLMYPRKPLMVDHINHDGLDNRKSNLRTCTNRENMSNLRSSGSSQYTGVSWHKLEKTWCSHITAHGKQRHLGYFKTEHEASLAYKEALTDLKG